MPLISFLLDKASDAAILKVIEAYCASGKFRALIRKLLYQLLSHM